MRLHDKIAIVTGAGRGIGRAIALRYAREGASVALASRTLEQLDELKQEIEAGGGRAIAIETDVSDEAQVEAMVGRTIRELGRVDILVNSAGIVAAKPAEELPANEWQRIIDINMTGTLLCCQAAGRAMLQSGGGKIVNISSMVAFMGIPGRVAYCASKGAVTQITRVLGIEWAARGINVNAIAPGYIETPMMKSMLDAGKLDRPKLVGRTPRGRLGRPEDIAAAAVYLASDDADFIVGETLVIDGGWLAYGFV